MYEKDKEHLLVLTEALVRMGYVNYIVDEAVKKELLTEKKNDDTYRLYVESDGKKNFIEVYYDFDSKKMFHVCDNEKYDKLLSKSNYRFMTFRHWGGPLVTPYAILGPKEKEIIKREFPSKLPDSIEDEKIKNALNKFDIITELKNIDAYPILYDLYKSMDSNGFVDNNFIEKNNNFWNYGHRGIRKRVRIYLLKKEKYPSLEENFYTYADFDKTPSYRNILGDKYSIYFGGLFRDIFLEDKLWIDKKFMKELIKPFFRKSKDYYIHLHFDFDKTDFLGYRVEFDMSIIESIFDLPLSRQNFEANSFILNYISEENKSRLYNFLIDKYDKNSVFPIEKHVSLIQRKNMNGFTNVLMDYLARNKVPSNSIREKKLLGILSADKSYFLEVYLKGPEEFDSFMQIANIHTQQRAMQYILDLPKKQRNPATEKLISEKYSSIIGDTFRKGVKR